MRRILLKDKQLNIPPSNLEKAERHAAHQRHASHEKDPDGEPNQGKNCILDLGISITDLLNNDD